MRTHRRPFWGAGNFAILCKTGHFMGVAATKCTKITWALYCDHSFNNPTKLILFFG